MKKKSEAFEKFKEFKSFAERESGMMIEALRADNGGEYSSEEFRQYLKEYGIRLESTAAYSPQQNGVAERKNRTLVEAARSMLSQAGLSNAYWAEAIATATYLQNRMMTAALKQCQTPYLLWHGERPNLEHIKVFGCAVYTHIPDVERRKLDKKARKLKFIGYTATPNNYKVWDEEKQRCYIRHDVVFNEHDFSGASVDVSNERELDLESKLEQENDLGQEGQEESEGSEVSTTVEPRRSGRARKPSCRYGIDEYADVASHTAWVVKEPNSIDEALKGEHASEWKAAADSEYNSLMVNKTWELVKLPKDRRTVGCKWVFRVKHNGDGKIECFKGRLVAQGFTQKYGIDYNEVFSLWLVIRQFVPC
jgi:hypothetical protein